MRLTVPLTGTAIQNADGTWGGDVSDKLTYDAQRKPSIPFGTPGNNPLRLPDLFHFSGAKIEIINIVLNYLPDGSPDGTADIEIIPDRRMQMMPEEQRVHLNTAVAFVASKSHAEHLAASGNAPLKKVGAN